MSDILAELREIDNLVTDKRVSDAALGMRLRNTFAAGTAADELAAWIAYADKLEGVLEIVCGQSKDQLMKFHAEQGIRLVRPNLDILQQTPGA